MIGLAAAPPVGVDLERTRPLNVARRRREEICAAAMSVAGAPLPHAEPDRALLQAWVRLEAFAKARGLGLARTLADLGLCGTGYPRPCPAQIEAAALHLARQTGLTVADVGLPRSLQGAAAVRSGRPCRIPATSRPTARASNGCCNGRGATSRRFRRAGAPRPGVWTARTTMGPTRPHPLPSVPEPRPLDTPSGHIGERRGHLCFAGRGQLNLGLTRRLSLSTVRGTGDRSRARRDPKQCSLPFRHRRLGSRKPLSDVGA